MPKRRYNKGQINEWKANRTAYATTRLQEKRAIGLGVIEYEKPFIRPQEEIDNIKATIFCGLQEEGMLV